MTLRISGKRQTAPTRCSWWFLSLQLCMCLSSVARVMQSQLSMPVHVHALCSGPTHRISAIIMLLIAVMARGSRAIRVTPTALSTCKERQVPVLLRPLPHIPSSSRSRAEACGLSRPARRCLLLKHLFYCTSASFRSPAL